VKNATGVGGRYTSDAGADARWISSGDTKSSSRTCSTIVATKRCSGRLRLAFDLTLSTRGSFSSTCKSGSILANVDLGN
jgi:hypothetical protein